ncbi:hypothetical protein Ciccas_004776 [Cichlidogyrus casuarinus]|uniref:Regulator of G-protein signaling 7 n=1 Tax=Cichlidogyrus casuarinus TaxID=1844966 RepID=A0ABD2QBC7_9PLAT
MSPVVNSLNLINNAFGLEISKVEELIGKMQNLQNGISFKNQKMFLTTIPAAITGYDVISWLKKYLNLDSVDEANHLASMLLFYGYIYSITDPKLQYVQDDPSILYRFQAPYYWVSKFHAPDQVDYAIYLVKRSLRNRQKYALEDFELSAREKLQRILCDKWEFICIQAEEQLRLIRERRRSDRLVMDSQERAFWAVHRPPPSRVNRLELNITRTRREKNCFTKQASATPSKNQFTKSVDNLCLYVANHKNFDWFLEKAEVLNPWCAEDETTGLSLDAARKVWPKTYCPLQSHAKERMESKISMKQVKLWATSFERLLADWEGISYFQRFLDKEFSGENLSFWLAVNKFTFGPKVTLTSKCKSIYEEFLSESGINEINLDRKTMAITEKNMENPNFFTFEEAQEHIYALMKNDSYVRFLRSEDYGSAMRTAVQHDAVKQKVFNNYQGIGPTTHLHTE